MHDSTSTLWARLVSRLNAIGEIVVVPDFPLSAHSSWQVGGPARVFVEPSSLSQVTEVLRILSEEDAQFIVVGMTSNILFDSRGYDGVVLRIADKMSSIDLLDDRVVVEAGIEVPELVRVLAEHGLGGISHAAGIPGTLGGLVVMNGGTQRRGIGENVLSVLVADRDGSTRRLLADELDFSYRHSSLQGSDWIVLNVELSLEQVDTTETLKEIDAIRRARSLKFPLTEPNCGSVFVSNPALYELIGPPGYVIEKMGFKGKRRGGAEVSELHANFIVNKGSATDTDILGLIYDIRHAVHDDTGVLMDCEVRFLSYDGHIVPAHVEAEQRLQQLG